MMIGALIQATAISRAGMIDPLNDLRSQNADLQMTIEEFLVTAPDAVRAQIADIALELATISSPDNAAGLEKEYQNLQRQAQALIGSGHCTAEDFEEELDGSAPF